ncbi:MAG TPA: hypothetical protein VFJ82_19965 [Longimicrobium sp.]|nr:hypothetical protein [Longimicrobium sp.]
MPYPNPQQFEEAWAKAVSRSWSDASYRRSLVADPAQALDALGVQVPSDISLKVGEGAKNIAVVLPLPAAPPQAAEGKLAASDDVSVTVSSSCCCSC